MKIIELLTSNQLTNINELINSYGKNNEFEVSLKSEISVGAPIISL
jgi:hypothetical protein